MTDDAPVRMRVRVAKTKRDGKFELLVDGEGARGAVAERRFEAASCAEAVDVLGLVIALAADEAGGDAAPAPPPETVRPVTDFTGDEPGPPVAETPPTRSFAIGAGAIGTTLGEGQLGARIALGFEWRRTLLPWIEASGALTFPHTIEGGGGSAEPRWITGRFALAPVGLEIGRAWRLSAFGALDLGALSASGSSAPRVESRTRAWYAIGVGLRSRWDLGSRFFAGLDVAMTVPLVRDSFAFANGGDVYRVPMIAAETAIFVGVRFP